MGEYGGKAIEEGLVRLYGKEAVHAFCEAAGNVIADTVKKLVTGG